MDKLRSIAELSNIISRNPYSAEAYYQHGIAYLQAEKRALRVVRDFDEAIKHKPRHTKAYSACGWTYLQMGKIGKAFADQTRAIDIAPKDPHLYYNRGRDCNRTEQFDDAICNFTHAINLNLQFAPAYSPRGTTCEAKSEIDKSRIDFDKADQIQNK